MAKTCANLYASSDTLEKMEALVPFNVKPEDLEAARAIPELIYPEKSVPA